MTATALVHDRLSTLADPTRGRILLAIDQNELTVGELCSVLELPQSTVSRHLRVLVDDRWLVTRQEGTSRYYSRNAELDAVADRLWSVVAEDLRAGPNHRRDSARLRDVIAQRRAKSREFFASSAIAWDDLRQELFGSAVGGGALLGLLDETWVAGDLGCGSGHLSALLAPFVARVIGVDGSSTMLARARERLAGVPNVDLREGELEALPVRSGEIDAAVLSLVLHHAPAPLRVLQEAHRALKPDGRVVIVDMLTHDRAEFRDTLGHVWLGFSERQIVEWMSDAGFTAVRFISLPGDRPAAGPELFVATGKRSSKRE
jgi:ArsR family transcriptional regulator